ncbi:MAG: hypothetical protein QOF20_3432 [Acidimicrobiaceae bacterium]|jgi:hypothetical protein|nr:hypothetical protein [Acidimicrobiaceae bacterium]MDQ1364122.1 hypothetical protein [Acidimicrobiaceae bacterium]MDQ1371079.1 hypothetical protein [Acidimicrobiaceae bacterium]MDQ1376545.1 hypothetical protein [Acidimicrobiaceae bacterium]MDQ1398220.1 hypothetical protein [Acidimicrobiaceae bacterium]
MDINQFLGADRSARTPSDSLRWTSDFLDLASHAIAIIACAQGLTYPPDLYQSAQEDLLAWARYLDDRPSIAVDFELARFDPEYRRETR